MEVPRERIDINKLIRDTEITRIGDFRPPFTPQILEVARQSLLLFVDGVQQALYLRREVFGRHTRPSPEQLVTAINLTTHGIEGEVDIVRAQFKAWIEPPSLIDQIEAAARHNYELDSQEQTTT